MDHLKNKAVEGRTESEVSCSCPTPAMSVALQCSCETEEGALSSAFTQIALTERTESFVPKTKPNLCQTNELKRPTWEVNTNEQMLGKYTGVLVVSVYFKLGSFRIC